MSFDEEYIREILDAARAVKPMTRADFLLFCRKDINGGWGDEVAEAYRRYAPKDEPLDEPQRFDLI